MPGLFVVSAGGEAEIVLLRKKDCSHVMNDPSDILTISFEMAYGKSLLKSVKMKTQSGPVLYTNLLGLPPMLLFATFGGEFVQFSELRQEKVLFTTGTIVLLILGSVAGTGIGYSSWWYVKERKYR